MVGRKSIKKYLRSKLLAIKQALRKRLHRPIGETGAWLQRALLMHWAPASGFGVKALSRIYLIELGQVFQETILKNAQRPEN